MIRKPTRSFPFILATFTTHIAVSHAFTYPHTFSGSSSGFQLKHVRSHRYAQDTQMNEAETSTDMKATTNAKVLSEAQMLKMQAQKARLEADKAEATLALEKISLLEKQLRDVISNNEKRDEIKQQIEKIARNMDPSFVPQFASLSNKSSPNTAVPTATSTQAMTSTTQSLNLTPTELYEAHMAFLKLPLQVQRALAKAMDIDVPREVISRELSEEILQKLNQQQKNLLKDPKKLQDAYKQIMDRPQFSSPSFITLDTSNLSTKDEISDDDLEKEIQSIFGDMGFDLNEDPESRQLRRFMESGFPRTTRKDGAAPTQDDVDYFFNVILDAKNVFNPTSKPERIPGGFIIRGQSKLKDEADVVEAIDNAFIRSDLAENYNFFYVRDPTPEALEDMEDFFGKPVLLLMGKDMAPETNRLILTFTSSLSLLLIFLFALGSFASNEVIVNRLQEANAVGDYDLEWFNGVFAPLLFPIIGILGVHEAAHLFVAKTNNFKVAAPTILPAVTLPTFGCNTAIKTSPPNIKTMFDFALSGPVAGIVASFALLLVGLQMTTGTTDSSVYSYFPAIPIQILQFSRLGGSIVDASLGGVLTSSLTSDVPTIQLHPFAIAGYTGLVTNALNLLPLGNSDGGRISQAIFGRNGHSVIQGMIYLAIFGSSFFGFDQSNILLAYGLFCLFGQSELEIPCRDEIVPVPLPRVFIALGAWTFVGLTLLPLV